MESNKTSEGSASVEINAEDLPSQKFHGKRVRLVRVAEGASLSVERYELSQRIGKEGVADALTFDDQYVDAVTVLFDDGMRLLCLLEELEICELQEAIPSGGRSAAVEADTFIETRFAQACITHVSFPNSLAELALIAKEEDTDMEQLLWCGPDTAGGSWTCGGCGSDHRGAEKNHRTRFPV